jgi:CRP-like cAMP-binding protein
MISSNSPESDIAKGNQLLAALPETDYQQLRSHFEWVEMPSGTIIYDVGEDITDLYFPIRSLVSLISVADETTEAEFTLIGSEGMVGLPALLGGGSTPGKAIVQVADGAMQIDVQTFNATFEKSDVLQKQLLLYTQLTLTQAAQNVTCRTHHRVKNRFARWLLSIQDRLQTPEVPLTHQYAAKLLGTRRATISETVASFQQQGLIKTQRGKMTICDRPALEQIACSCYAVLQQEYARLQAMSQTL